MKMKSLFYLDDHDIIYIYNLLKSKIQYLKGLAYIVENFSIYNGFHWSRDFSCDVTMTWLFWSGLVLSDIWSTEVIAMKSDTKSSKP